MRTPKLLAVVLAVAAAVGALAGCSAISSGTITDKHYRAAYQSSYWTTHCMSYDSEHNCTMSIPVEQKQHHPDRWTFDLRAGDKDGWVEVSQATYDMYKIGDYYGDSAGGGRF
mgnify:CR=1 FL=1